MSQAASRIAPGDAGFRGRRDSGVPLGPEMDSLREGCGPAGPPCPSDALGAPI